MIARNFQAANDGLAPGSPILCRLISNSKYNTRTVATFLNFGT